MTTLERVEARQDRSSTILNERPPLVRAAHTVRRSGLKYTILGLAVLVSNFPFYWMFVVASTITVLVLFFSTMAGFAFAKMRFRGRAGLFTFLFAWNDFLWPLVVLGNNPGNHTIQIALRTLSDTYYVNYSMVMAGTLLSVVPLLLAFVLFSRQMIAGAMEGAVKG